MCATTCESFIAIRWTFYSMLLVGQHRVLQPVKFLNFQTIVNMFSTCESFIAIGWMVCAPGRTTSGRPTPASIIFNFFIFPKPLRACLQLVKISSQSHEWCVLLVRQHRLVNCLFFLYFQNHCEHVYNLWIFHRNRMNGVCSCRESATPDTPASTIFKFFKFPKPPRACLQQFLKVSSQSDERCVLF